MALLVFDIQNQICNQERRPRCIESVPKIVALLEKARGAGIPVVHSLTSSAEGSDIRKEVTPVSGEPVVKSAVDKFYGTELEDILKSKSVETVILVRTSAHRAVLNTATGSAARGFNVVVPVDGNVGSRGLRRVVHRLASGQRAGD